MEDILIIVNKYIEEFKKELKITEEINTEITNKVFIHITFRNHNEFLWCDYLLSDANAERKIKNIISFIESFFVNAFYTFSVSAYSNILKKRFDEGKNV